MHAPPTTEPKKPTTAKQQPFFGGGAMPFFQPKLTINQPGDAYEQEADRVADDVMRMQEGDAPVVQRMALTPVVSVQRACAECGQEEELQRKEDNDAGMPTGEIMRMAATDEEEETPVQRKCADCEQKEQAQRKETAPSPALPRSGEGVSGKAAPSIVSDVLSSGSGRPMDSDTRGFMESRFGQDFSQVRIHTDSRAVESASAIQARAYTSGRDVVFGAGEYQPGSDSGKRLLAHELVHVGQQTGAIQRQIAPQTAAPPSAPAPATPSEPAPVSATPGDLSGPQRRRQVRTATLSRDGQGNVRIIVERYLCGCRRTNRRVAEANGRLSPNPQFDAMFRDGCLQLDASGQITGSRAELDGGINYAENGQGVRVEGGGFADTSGRDPVLGGRAGIGGRVGDTQLGVTGGAAYDTGTRQSDGGNLGLHFQSGDGPAVNLGLGNLAGLFSGGNPLNSLSLNIGGTFGGPRVRDYDCYVCYCPPVYRCREETDVTTTGEPQITPTLPERTPGRPQALEPRLFRYYFAFASTETSENPTLASLSDGNLDTIRDLLAQGWSLGSFEGHASPEGRSITINARLSLERENRLRRMLGQASVRASSPPSGELMPHIPDFSPELQAEIRSAGYRGPEDLRQQLTHREDFRNELAPNLRRLFAQMTRDSDRVLLFGIQQDNNPEVAGMLVNAIHVFMDEPSTSSEPVLAERPWDHVFRYLRFAAVTVNPPPVATPTQTTVVPTATQTPGESTTQTTRRELPVSECRTFAEQAERQGLFGRIEMPPAYCGPQSGREAAGWEPLCR